MAQNPTVGIISPGDMGHVVGERLIAHGAPVITALQGRSERTQALARKANIQDVGDLEQLTQTADIILSILVPAEAVAASVAVSKALARTGATPLYVDCNAIAPQTVQQIDQIMTAAGARFVDASIIGPPPRKPGATRFYASGLHSAEFAQLRDFGLDVIGLGEQVGAASALKMCYAALTKGLTALCAELLTAAQALGVAQPLADEFKLSQAMLYDLMQRQLPGMPPKARRWVGEMEEIAQTFAHVGLTPQILAGAADIYRFVGETPLADRTPEDPTPPPGLSQMVEQLAQQLSTTE